MPGGTGGQIRQFSLLSRLRERGRAVTVVAPVHPSQREGAALLAESGIRLVAVERPASRVAEVLAAVAREPALAFGLLRDPIVAWQVQVFWTRLRSLAWTESKSCDVVLVEHDWAARWRRDLPAALPVALALENLSWEYYAARAEATDGVARRLLLAESRRFADFDARFLAAYDLLIAVSDRDRRSLAALSRRPCVVIPNGVDTSAGLPLSKLDGPATVLYTGTMDYPPNAEGLLWLLREIWPRIQASHPDARLVVVGRNPPEAARELAGSRVDLMGFVEDIGPCFQGATVAVVPILSGGGTRLKVLDAFSHGLPVVSTTLGCSGIACRDGEHLSIADHAEVFSQRVLDLLADRARGASLGAAARQLAEERYDWGALGDQLDSCLSSLVAS